MNTTQTKHVIPTKEQSVPLISTGMEKAIKHSLSSDFIFTAKEDGEVMDIDNDAKIVTIKYKSGKIAYIDFDVRLAKNSNGGFYAKNIKDLSSKLKKGYKFKDGEVLAKNSSFFMDDEDASLSLGRLTKIAMCSSDATYEDSAFISDGFADAMTSEITMQKSITLGVNTNILQMVKKGQEIKSGEPLLMFEHSFEDAATAKLFDNIHSDDLSVFQDLSKNVVKSKYTGVIEDIVIYYNKPVEEMTPSLQKILKGYIKEVEKKEKVVKDSSVIMKNAQMIEGSKIKGQDVDGVLIEIYVTYKDVLSVGDKISWFAGH